MIPRVCLKCKNTYNWELNSQECPHIGFPRAVKCSVHKRTNCGMPECRTEVLELMHFGPGGTEVILDEKETAS